MTVDPGRTAHTGRTANTKRTSHSSRTGPTSRTGDSRTGAAHRWVLGSVRLGWGLVLLTAPDRVGRALGAPPGPATRRLARVLGARHVVQAAVELATWPRWSVAGAAVDGAHAATGLVAGADPRWRRPALLDAAVAAGLAGAGLAGHRS